MNSWNYLGVGRQDPGGGRAFVLTVKTAIMRSGFGSMRAQILAIGLVAAVMLSSADKKPPVRSMENADVEIIATPIADREAVRQALGSDLGGHYILVDVRV